MKRKPIYSIMQRTFAWALLSLAGCGGSEPKVQLPDNPTPVPRPEDRLKPLGAPAPQPLPASPSTIE
ncbi:MAG: hypothetical protein C0485_17825 [Pirellula sp.]|nr:hypothetical protein [Pirellula sp.]